MKASILIFLVTAINLVGCVHRADSDRMLDHRAGYEMELNAGEMLLPDSNRRKTRSAIAWIHPNRMPSGDFLWGAWVSLKIDDPRWNLYVPRYDQEGMFLGKD